MLCDDHCLIFYARLISESTASFSPLRYRYKQVQVLFGLIGQALFPDFSFSGNLPILFHMLSSFAMLSLCIVRIPDLLHLLLLSVTLIVNKFKFEKRTFTK